MMKKNNFDILTPREHVAEERRAKVIEMYARLKKEYPKAPVSRLFNACGERYRMTGAGVRALLTRKGIYKKGGAA